MDTPAPKTLTGIRTLAKDMAKRSDSKTVTTSATTPSKTKNPVPKSAFVDDGEKNVYQAPNETKPIDRKEQESEINNKDEVLLKPIKSKIKTAVKSIPESNLKSDTSTNIAAEPAIIVDNEDAASATIIRDTKHNRFRLFPAISTSLKLWFAGVKEKYFTKKLPKYTVPETTRRKGVIQEATSKTGKLTTFDRTSLQERIRQRQERAVPKTPTTTWSPNTEPGFLLLEEPDEELEDKPKIANVTVVPRKSFRTTPPDPKPVVPTPIPPPPVIPPKPIAPVIEAPVVVPKVVEPAIETTSIPTLPTPNIATPPPTQTVLVSSLPLVRTLASEETSAKADTTERAKVAVNPTSPQRRVVGITRLAPKNLREWLFSLNTNFISLGVIGLMLAVSLIGFGGYIWFKTHSQNLTLTTTPSYPTLLSVPLQTLFLRDLSKDNFLNQIVQNQKQSKYETLEIGLITTPSGESLLPPAKIFDLLDSNVSAVFSHSINNIYFGTVNKTTPFIVIKTTDTATARGGLLSWEGSMYKSLQPYFSAFVPSYIDDLNLAEANFTDTIVNGVDARVLLTANSVPVLIYALTKQNILIITTDEKTLTELFTLIPKS